MAINIKNPETHRLAQELAQKTGKSMTEAITEAIREKLQTLKTTASRQERLKQIAKTASAHASEKWKNWDYDADLYDETGLPK